MPTPKPPVRRRLALAGAIEGIWFLGFSLALGATRVGYDPAHDAISRLGEPGSDRPLLWNLAGFGVSGVLYAVYAVAIGDEFGRRWFFWATVLQAVSLAGGGVFSCDNGCPAATTSTHGALHTVFGLTYFAVTCLAPLIAALTFRRHDRWRRLCRISYLVGVLLIAMFIVGPLFGEDHHGLWQRLVLVPALAWQAAVSLRLYRLPARAPAPVSPVRSAPSPTDPAVRGTAQSAGRGTALTHDDVCEGRRARRGSR